MSGLLHLQIDSMAYGGKGVGRIDGKVYFVLDAIVGDLLAVRVTEDSGRYADAEIVDILKPSTLRGEPACRFAKTCGGCQWQGIAYDQQLEWKQSFVTNALTRIGKLGSGATVTTLGSPAIQNYRNRVLLRARLLDNGKITVGYFQRQSRDLVEIDRCSIAAESINQFLSELLALKIGSTPAQKFRFEVQEVLGDSERNLVVTVYPGDMPAPGIENIVQKIAELPRVLWTGLVFALKDAPVVDFDRDLAQSGEPLVFKTLPGQFQQVNVAHNHRLRQLVKDLVSKHAPGKILDVFCGSGNLSLPLINSRCFVQGVESNAMAIAVARKNLSANQLSNAVYLTGDGEAHLWKLAKANETFDLVILDPPRQGMYQGMIPLKKIAPKTILYVSCDPTTLARDLGALCKNDRYKIASITAFDFFPNTYHIETVVELTLA